MRTIRAVLFDMGGVLCESPFAFFAAYERERGVAEHTIAAAFARCAAHYSMLECGAIDVDAFCVQWDAVVSDERLRGRALFDALHAYVAQPRAAFFDAIRRMRAERPALRIAAVTNNWRDARATGHALASSTGVGGDMLRASGLFDAVIESCVLGVRKPDAGIFTAACAALGVQPDECVFLDDIGANLRGAAQLGMHTIRVPVHGPEHALAELDAVLRAPGDAPASACL